MSQKEFLLELEQTCAVKEPIFINSRDSWDVPDSALKWAKDLMNLPSIGRYRLTLENSDVSELWFDLEAPEGSKFSDLAKLALTTIKLIQSFGIKQEYIYKKLSGHGIHIQVFILGLRSTDQLLMLAKVIHQKLPMSKTHSLGSDSRCLVKHQKIREFGGENGEHYTTAVKLKDLQSAKRKKKYPINKKADAVVYPKIKVFECTSQMIRRMHELEGEFIFEEEKKTYGTEMDYDKDGDVQSLYKCPTIKRIANKAKTEEHITHMERLGIATVFMPYGEEGLKEIHKIIGYCKDYKLDNGIYTQWVIDDLKKRGYKPMRCETFRERVGCPEDCKGSGGKSPFKFAWSPITLEELKKSYRKWLCLTTPKGNEDAEILDSTMAVAKDRELAGDPVWTYLVAESGGTKTEIIRALNAWNVEAIDTLTAHTLISGKIIKDPKTGKMRPVKGLLSRLNGKILTIKDFTIVLQGDPRERYVIFSQFRGAYDGYYASSYGTWDKPIKLDVEFTVLAGVTPVIDIHSNLAAILGERFLKIRHEVDREKAARKAMENTGKEKQMRKELVSKTKRFLANLKMYDPKMPEEIFEAILNLSLFIAQIRMPIPYNIKAQATAGIPVYFETKPEYATRLGKQLLKFSKLISIVRQKPKVDWKDYGTTLRIGFDTAPQNRLKLILYLYFNPNQSASEISHGLEWYLNKTRRVVAELTTLWQVLKRVENPYSDPLNLHPTLKKYMKGMLTKVGESVYSNDLLLFLLKKKRTFTTLKGVNIKGVNELDEFTIDRAYTTVAENHVNDFAVDELYAIVKEKLRNSVTIG